MKQNTSQLYEELQKPTIPQIEALLNFGHLMQEISTLTRKQASDLISFEIENISEFNDDWTDCYESGDYPYGYDCCDYLGG